MIVFCFTPALTIPLKVSSLNSVAKCMFEKISVGYEYPTGIRFSRIFSPSRHMGMMKLASLAVRES